MAQIITQATTSLWRPGNKGNIEFVASFKRLEREAPDVYGVIEQREGFTVKIGEFEYHVGRNQYGLWLSRRRLGLEGLHNIEKDSGDKPPARPPMRDVNVADTTLILAISQITEKIGEIVEGLKLVALSSLAQSEEERQAVREKLVA